MTLLRFLTRGLVIVLVLILTGAQLSAVAAPGDGDLVTNGQFTEVGSDGLPVGWGSWAPSGTSTVEVEPTAGPRGDPAVRIEAVPTTDESVRRAITQRIAVDDATPRSLRLTGYIKADGLATSGFTAIRVQGHKADGTVSMPVQYVGRLSGTFGWTEARAYLDVPLGTTRISVEPMLDRSGGTVWFDDISLAPATSAGHLQASVTPYGHVELSWDFSPEEPASYAVHRTEGGVAPVIDDRTLLRRAYAETTADNDTEPGATYTYVVVAYGADGEVLAESDPAIATVAADVVNRQEITVLTALETNDGVEAAWQLAADRSTAGDLSIFAAADPQAEGELVATVPATDERLTLPAGTGPHLRLMAGDEVLDYTVVGTTEHPRTVVTASTLDRVRQTIETDPTAKGAWEQIVTRADEGDYSGAAGMLYRARDAAFIYAVTEDEKYADMAFESLVAGSDYVQSYPSNMGLKLGRANLLLAPTYDWAYEGWTQEQRQWTRQLMLRSVDLLSTYHHDNIDGPDKASNWIGVASTTELAVLLSARGDGDFGLHEERIAYLTNLVKLHLREGYTDTGYTQEGWDYFHYAGLYMLPSAYAAMDAGMVSLLSELERPAWWNLALHTLGTRPSLDMLQWGVGTQRNQTNGILPLLMPISPDDAVPGLQWQYDQTRGIGLAEPIFDGLHSLFTVLYYPGGTGDVSELTAPEAYTAILDDGPGFYEFRSGYTGPDDVLVTLNNRNRQHKGWSGSETFGLSMMGFDTTWAVMGDKRDDPSLFSVPLVDGQIQPRSQYHTDRAEGVTLASRAYAGQGGGYVHLDGSRNLEVDSAVRQAVVDLGDEDVAVLAFDDRFSDGTTTHDWDWQLRPADGVDIEIGDGGAFDFRFTSDSGVLTGWVVGEGEPRVVDGALQVHQSGPEARFQIVLAVAAEQQQMSRGEGSVVTVAGRTLDLDDLGSYVPVVIDPQVIVPSGAHRVGEPVEIGLEGFAPQEVVEVTVADVSAETTMDASGTGSVSVTPARRTRAGTYEVTAVGQQSGATTTGSLMLRKGPPGDVCDGRAAHAPPCQTP